MLVPGLKVSVVRERPECRREVGAALGDVELAEARERNLLSRRERILDRLDHRVDRRTGVLLAEAARRSDLINEVRLRHDSSLSPGRD